MLLRSMVYGGPLVVKLESVVAIHRSQVYMQQLNLLTTQFNLLKPLYSLIESSISIFKLKKVYINHLLSRALHHITKKHFKYPEF